MRKLFIGLMSGTSIDGIDAVLVRFADRSVRLIESQQCDYPQELQQRLRAAVDDPDACGIDELGALDNWVGECFRDAAIALLDAAGVSASDVVAIGSHGQTLCHRPDGERRFTLQIGDPSIIATGSSIDTVADFRRADVALGGEGAPLVPPFHDWLFRDSNEHRAVLNIGGIANISVLPPDESAVAGFDTGPGNTLLDQWIRKNRNCAFDADGAWASSGTVNEGLLERLLAEPWFATPPPKSTGVELFNLDWLQRHSIAGTAPEDVQATLAEFTAASIVIAVGTWAPATTRLLVCGGGAHNSDLLARLGRRLGSIVVDTTAAVGLDPDWVEATAFAWLAKRHVDGRAGNLPSATGANRKTVLGATYPAGANAQ